MSVEEADGLPAAPTSVLAGLRQRRQDILDTLHLDLAVPRYDPPIYVRFRPATQLEIDGLGKQFEKSKDPDKNVRLNAAQLARCCVGIFGEGEEIDPDQPVKFDQRLGEMLGMDPEFAKSGVAVVRSLYFTDGDIIATATRLAEWSGYSLAGVEEREGN